MSKKSDRQAWIDALRSGKYQQATRRLRIGNSFCCLGVLCDILSPQGWLATGQPDWQHPWRHIEQHPIGDFPGLSMLGRVGLSFEDAGNLGQLNDNGSSFAEIASVIEGLPYRA